MARKRRASPPPPTPPREEPSSSDEDEEEDAEATPATLKAPQNPKAPSTAAADADSSDGSGEESSDSEDDAEAIQLREVDRSPGKPSAAASKVESVAGEEGGSSSESPEPVQKKAARTPKAKAGKNRQAAESTPSGKAKKAKADVEKAAPESTLSGKVKKAKAGADKSPSEPNPSSKGKKHKAALPEKDQSPSGKPEKPASRQRWTTEDEIKILEALVSHIKANGTQPSATDLIAAVGDSLERKNCGKSEMYEKVRLLKQTHEINAKKAARTGTLPGNDDDLRKFSLSVQVWGERANEVASSKSKKVQTNKEKNVDKSPSEPNPSSKGKKHKAALPEKDQSPSDKPEKPASRQRWTTEDEIKILEALVSHIKANGTQPSATDLIAAVGDSLGRKNCGKSEMYEKVRLLKQTHEINAKKAARTGTLPGNDDDLRKFSLSVQVWGERANEVASSKSKKVQTNKEKNADKSPSEPNPSSKGKKHKAALPEKDQSPSGKPEKPASRQRWTTEDEIKILEALVSHIKANGTQPSATDLIAAVGDSLERKNCGKSEMYEKVRLLKQTHEINAKKAARTGTLPGNDDDLRKFSLSVQVLGERANEVASSKSKKVQTNKEKKADDLSKGVAAKEATSTKEKVDGDTKGRLSKKASTTDTPAKSKKRQNHEEELETDAAKTGTTKETTNASAQNGGTLVRSKSGKSDKEKKDVDAESLGPKEATAVTQNDGNLTLLKNGETHEEKMDTDSNLKNMLKRFDELQDLYPNLTSYVESIQAQHPCGETLKRAFEFIADEKACALESKIRKQRLAELKMDVRRADTKKEVTNIFIGLLD